MNDTGDISPELKLETDDAELDLGNVVSSPSKLYQSQGFPTETPSTVNNKSKVSSVSPFSANFCVPCQKIRPSTGSSSSSLNYLTRSSRDLNTNRNNYENAYHRLDNNTINNNPSLSSIPSSSSSLSRNFFSRIWSSFFLHTRLLPFWQYPSYEDEEQQEVLLELLYDQLQYELFHSNEI
jgi:hypothetical protein